MLHNRWFITALLAVLVFASIAVFVDRSITESARQPSSTIQPTRAFKDPKLSPHLIALVDSETVGPAASRPKFIHDALAAGRMRLTPVGEVQVYISIADEAAIDDLRMFDVVIERVDLDLGLVQALVSIGRLRAVAALRSVRKVRLPNYPFTNAGSVQSEGDAVMKSDELRSQLSVDGSGVTVGVISDGVAGLATSQGLGDLPAVDTSTCNVVADSPTASAAGAEGTAMLEIIHDIAPAASLIFGHFGFNYSDSGTDLDFNAAVDCLAANADIVVDDIGWFAVGPYDGTSSVSENTAAALNGPGPIRGYFTAVGNQAQDHYQEPYAESSTVLRGSDIDPLIPPDDTWVFHEFDATGGPKGTKHAGLAAAPADGNRLILAPDGSLSIFLLWDDPWGSSLNDYDLFIRDGSDIYLCGGAFQGPAPDSFPAEACFWENTGPTDLELDIMIGNYLGGAAPVEFDMFLLCNHCSDLGNGNSLDFNTAGSSVSNQSDAGGSPASVISVGSVDLNDTNAIRTYSSRGLTEDGRGKPDLVTADGVCITGSGGFGDGTCQGSGTRFFGTSAAAPHAAAVAALLLECNPDMSRVELYDRMVLSAIDLGETGPDNVYGHGRLNAQTAAEECAGGLAATPTPNETASPQASATPTLTPDADAHADAINHTNVHALSNSYRDIDTDSHASARGRRELRRHRKRARRRAHPAIHGRSRRLASLLHRGGRQRRWNSWRLGCHTGSSVQRWTAAQPATLSGLRSKTETLYHDQTLWHAHPRRSSASRSLPHSC